MRSSAIKVCHELSEDRLEMFLAEWNQVVEAFPPKSPDESFAKCVGLRGMRRNLQHTNAEAVESAVHVRSEDAVPIVDHEPVRMIERQELTELLRGPVGRRMLGHVKVQDSARTDLHRDEDVQDSEVLSNYSEEITGDDCLRMASYKRIPTLSRSSTRAIRFEILPNRSRRDLDAELKAQFVRNPFLTPRWILPGHLADQFPEVVRQRRASALPRLPTPEQAEYSPMPFHEGLGFDDHYRVPPVEEVTEGDHEQAKDRRSSLWLHVPLAE